MAMIIDHVGYTPVVLCKCGEEVLCDVDCAECEECGRIYNVFGQELRPVTEWYDEMEGY